MRAAVEKVSVPRESHDPLQPGKEQEQRDNNTMLRSSEQVQRQNKLKGITGRTTRQQHNVSV